MPVRLRLQRFGRKKSPFYRLVAADSRASRDGKFIEMLGTYDPIAREDKVKEVRLNMDRIRYWLGVGAQPSDRVARLLAQAGAAPVPPQRIRPHKATPRAERGLCTWAAPPPADIVENGRTAMAVSSRAMPPAHGSGGNSVSTVFETILVLQPELFGHLLAIRSGGVVTNPLSLD